MDDKQYRQPPNNVDAERGFLGCLLLDPQRTLDRVSEIPLTPDSFWLPEHGIIWESCMILSDRGRPIDITTLQAYLTAERSMDAVGGAQYLGQLMTGVISLTNAPHYARQLVDLEKRRGIVEAAERAINVAMNPRADQDATEVIDTIEADLYRVSGGDTGGGVALDMRTALDRAMEGISRARQRDDGLIGLSSGYRDVDKVLGGMIDEGLYILAGRPSMGKSALAAGIGLRAAQHGVSTAMWSLEMSSEQLATRLLGTQAKTPSFDMARGEISDDQFDHAFNVARQMHELPLYIEESHSMNLSRFRSSLRRLIRRYGVRFGIVDYLQLMVADDPRASKVHQIEAITNGLKQTAKEFGIPIMLLSQLSRAVEQRDPPVPQLSDLRDSGAIEQDADGVMFLYREEYYLRRKMPQPRDNDTESKYSERLQRWKDRLEEVANLADLIVAKNRHGPVGQTKLTFLPEYTAFENWGKTDGTY